MPNAFGFGKCVCTCVRKHSNAFNRTSLNWLKNLKCVWHEPKIHVIRLPRFGSVSVWWVLIGSFKTNVSKTTGQIYEIELVYRMIYHKFD